MFNLSGSSHVLTKNLLPSSILEEKIEESSCIRTIINEEKELLDFDAIEKEYIIKSLKIYGDSTEGKKSTAEKMGIGLTTLYRKMKRYGLD